MTEFQENLGAAIKAGIADKEAARNAHSASDFRAELEGLINRHSMENGCDTPDFILAEFLMASLAAFDAAVISRAKWYGPNRVHP